MFTEDKVTEIFFMADEFCRFFDSRILKYALRDHKKRIYHRESTMSKSEIMVIIISLLASWELLRNIAVFPRSHVSI